MAELFTAYTYLQNVFDINASVNLYLTCIVTRGFVYILHVSKQITVLQKILQVSKLVHCKPLIRTQSLQA